MLIRSGHWAFSIRCPKCKKVKSKAEFHIRNTKMPVSYITHYQQIPVCDDCELEIKTLRLQKKEVINN